MIRLDVFLVQIMFDIICDIGYILMPTLHSSAKPELNPVHYTADRLTTVTYER